MEFITKAECRNCLDVKHIFEDFIEKEKDFCVLDAYPFGYLVLEWFDEERGFANQKFFYSASNGNQQYQELKEQMPAEAKEDMEQQKHEYIMQYENAAMLWESQKLNENE